MYDDEELDLFERYLETAPILDTSAWGRPGAHRSFRLILRGGVGVLAKPADVIADGETLVRREVAAWNIARELGWPDLMAATVRRNIQSPDSGHDVEASLQVLWPDVQPDADINGFLEEDTCRAAIFGFVIGHTDRGGHNWLALPNEGQPPRLKLNDHGYGFPDGVVEPNSSFYQLHREQSIPDELLTAVGRIADPRLGLQLAALLSRSAVDGIRSRAQRLTDLRRLGI